MPISGQVPSHLVLGARAGFLRALKTTPVLYPAIAMTHIMDGKSTDLVDLGATPMPRENKTGQMLQQFVERKLAVEPQDWDITVHYSHNALMDDRTNDIQQRVRGAGINFNRHMDKLCFQALSAGDAGTYGLCYNGFEFFDTLHVDDYAKYTTAQSNLGTTAFSIDAYEAARIAMSLFRDDQGEFAGFLPSLIVTDPTLEREAGQLATNPNEYGSGNLNVNLYQNGTQSLATPYLDSASWVLVDNSGPNRPIILALREAPSLQDAWFDPSQPDGGYYMFKFYARYTVAYGDWRTAYMGKT